jgi:hypothetical protein
LQLTKELAAHEQSMTQARAEIEAAKKQTANALVAAKADAAEGAKLKTAWQRKLSAFEAA